MNEIDLKRFSVFSDLTSDDLEAVRELLEPVRSLPGQQVVREGQEADGLLLVTRGRLRVENRREGDLGHLQAGSVIGVLSLVGAGPRELTAVAEGDTQVVVLSRTAFHRLAEDAPRAACRLLETVLRDLSGTLRQGIDRLS